MRYLLDTNTCIRFLTGRSVAVSERMRQFSPSQIFLCSIVRAELSYSAWKSSKPQENFTRQMYFCSQFHSFPFDDIAAERCGEIHANLSAAGQIIGTHDLQIASIAIVNGLILVTHSLREFSRIEHLMLEDWER